MDYIVMVTHINHHATLTKLEKSHIFTLIINLNIRETIV